MFDIKFHKRQSWVPLDLALVSFKKTLRLTQPVNCTQNPNGSLNYGSLRRIAPLLDIRTGWPSWGRLLCIIPLLLFTFQPGTQQEQIQYIQTCNRASAFLSTIALSCQRDCVHVITTHLLQSSLTWFIKKTLNHDLTSLHIWAKSLSLILPPSLVCDCWTSNTSSERFTSNGESQYPA